MNPACLVPSLCIDGEVLAQSVAIMEYLEETRPGSSFIPKNPLLRAKVNIFK
jgi:maleylacetoacetate isomerase